MYHHAQDIWVNARCIGSWAPARCRRPDPENDIAYMWELYAMWTLIAAYFVQVVLAAGSERAAPLGDVAGFLAIAAGGVGSVVPAAGPTGGGGSGWPAAPWWSVGRAPWT